MTIKIVVNKGYSLLNQNTFVYSQLIYRVKDYDFLSKASESDSPFEQNS